jgi:ComF family protein
MLEMPQTNYHLDQGNRLYQRLSSRIPVGFAIAFLRFSKNGRVQQLLHALKYKGLPELGVMLGKVYAQKLKDEGIGKDINGIVPVPLHSAKKRQRGYNQSEKFAEGLSDILEVPYFNNILIRTTKTQTQTTKSKLARWDNVKAVFEVRTAALPHVGSKHLLLVDDVITTGATLEACWEALRNSGVQKISVACLAEA